MSAARSERVASPARYSKVATAPCHFGELLQGTVGGEVVLVTLPHPALVTADWRPGRPGGALPGAPLPDGWVRRLARAAGVGPGRLRVSHRFGPGLGTGLSTAALVAAARAMGMRDPDRLARLCVGIEGASDPAMWPDPGAMLWASREGRVRGRVPRPPVFEAVGVIAGPPERTDPSDRRFAPVEDLVADWRRGSGSREAVAEIATRSARGNWALRGGPDPEPLIEIGRACGALGLAAAHTGPARALLFAPGTVRPALVRGLLGELGLAPVTRFLSDGRWA